MKNKWLLALALNLVVLAAATSLHASGALEAWQARLTHPFYTNRSPKDIVLVGIDDKTLSAPEAGGLGSMKDWSRTHFSTLIENLRSAGAHSIYMDIVLRNESQSVSYFDLANLYLETKSTEKVGDAVMSYLQYGHPQDAELEASIQDDVFFLRLLNSGPWLENNILKIDTPPQDLPIFLQKANPVSAQGSAEGEQDIVYSFPLGYQTPNGFEESVPLALARDFLYPQGGSVGVFIDGNTNYLFDEERTIPVEKGSFVLPYLGPAYSFPVFSFTDVVRGLVDPTVFEGKIVLVGATSPILQDIHFTPTATGIPMPGVEILANGIQGILEGKFLQHQSVGSFALTLLPFLLLLSIANLRLPVFAGLGVLFAEGFALWGLGFWLFQRGLILDLLWMNFALILAYFAILAYRNATEFREKRKLKSAFGHYVSPALVEHLSEHPEALHLGGERRMLSVLFLDLVHFTTLSEHMEPQEMVATINTYFSALTDVILAHQGTVDKFEGDAIMALFGAPVEDPHHAQEACLTALALQMKMKELNVQTGKELAIRVGIATGEAIVGNMGSKNRFDYTAMGDTVNTASRLEGVNKFYGTGILVNGGTVEATRDLLVFRPVDRVRLKGKQDITTLYQLLGTKAEATPETLQTLDVWLQGVTAYTNGQWELAQGLMQKVLLSWPQDGPATTLLARIEGFLKTPPPAWDGVWVMEEK